MSPGAEVKPQIHEKKKKSNSLSRLFRTSVYFIFPRLSVQLNFLTIRYEMLNLWEKSVFSFFMSRKKITNKIWSFNIYE